jgi:iron(III) transport system ATP-binding protein
VFQDGALFPHLTVEQNIGFGLRGLARSAQTERIGALLGLVGLAGLEGRYPHQLSGGQQQRVALARALAPNPPVMLLDEPFANLDAALRRDLAQEVERIVHDAASATVFVTHDQEEALSTADIVAVMDAGRIVQVGAPRAIYERPATRGVAAFVGEATFVAGDARGAQAATALGSVALVSPQHGAVEVLVRPEHVELLASEPGNAVVVRSTYFGYDQVVDVRTDAGMLVRARLRPEAAFAIGQRVAARVAGAVMAYPAA